MRLRFGLQEPTWQILLRCPPSRSVHQEELAEGEKPSERVTATMGSLFKKTITRPLPPGAEIITRKGERLARWRDGKGKLRTAPVTTGKDGTDRIRDESGTY